MEKGLKILTCKKEIQDQVYFMAKEKFYFGVCPSFYLQFFFIFFFLNGISTMYGVFRPGIESGPQMGPTLQLRQYQIL